MFAIITQYTICLVCISFRLQLKTRKKNKRNKNIQTIYKIKNSDNDINTFFLLCDKFVVLYTCVIGKLILFIFFSNKITKNSI